MGAIWTHQNKPELIDLPFSCDETYIGSIIIDAAKRIAIMNCIEDEKNYESPLKEPEI